MYVMYISTTLQPLALKVDDFIFIQLLILINKAIILSYPFPLCTLHIGLLPFGNQVFHVCLS